MTSCKPHILASSASNVPKLDYPSAWPTKGRSADAIQFAADFSPDYSDTWAALDRRVNEGMAVSRQKRSPVPNDGFSAASWTSGRILLPSGVMCASWR